jgi:ADP-ribosylglycohydrolase
MFSKKTKDTKSEFLDFSSDLNSRKKAVIYGILIGDSLGATSEFKRPNEVGKLIKNGWPLKYVGNNIFDAGEPTDDSDMAMCILESFISKKKFDQIDILKNYVLWYKNGPKDIGFATRRTLSDASSFLKEDMPWYKAGKTEFLSSPLSAPNGSLMRNGVIPVISLELSEISAIDQTVEQSIMTHYGPLPVLTCVIHTLLIRNALLSEFEMKSPPTLEDVKNLILNEWKSWKGDVCQRKDDHPCKVWLDSIGEKNLSDSETQLFDELKDFEDFDPYSFFYKGVSGYCVLSLKIALWALSSSFKEYEGKIPDWLPEWPFKRFAFESILWVVLIGADADTYGAIAGPLIAAYHPRIPKEFVTTLQLHKRIEKIMT